MRTASVLFGLCLGWAALAHAEGPPMCTCTCGHDGYQFKHVCNESECDSVCDGRYQAAQAVLEQQEARRIEGLRQEEAQRIEKQQQFEEAAQQLKKVPAYTPPPQAPSQPQTELLKPQSGKVDTGDPALNERIKHMFDAPKRPLPPGPGASDRDRMIYDMKMKKWEDYQREQARKAQPTNPPAQRVDTTQLISAPAELKNAQGGPEGQQPRGTVPGTKGTREPPSPGSSASPGQAGQTSGTSTSGRSGQAPGTSPASSTAGRSSGASPPAQTTGAGTSSGGSGLKVKTLEQIMDRVNPPSGSRSPQPVIRGGSGGEYESGKSGQGFDGGGRVQAPEKNP